MNKLKGGKKLINLIYINIVVFVLINIIHVFTYLLQENIEIISHLGISSNMDTLIQKPWTLITYMFVHENVFHIVVNLFWLYFGGKIFVEYLSQTKLISTYLMGGIIGAIIYIVSFNIFPVFAIIRFDSIAIGASASVLAILVAAATRVPNYPVIQSTPIKLKHIAIAAIIIDILSMPTGKVDPNLPLVEEIFPDDLYLENAGGLIAHLGGALYGFMYICLQKRNINSGYLIERIILLFSKKKKKKNKKRNESDYDYNARKKEEEKRINNILDKFNRSGYDSLSSEEKNELSKYK